MYSHRHSIAKWPRRGVNINNQRIMVAASSYRSGGGSYKVSDAGDTVTGIARAGMRIPAYENGVNSGVNQPATHRVAAAA